MSEQEPPTVPEQPPGPGVPPIPNVPTQVVKAPFSWGRFFIGAAILPAALLLLAALGAAGSAVADATKMTWPNTVTGLLGTAVMGGLFIGGIVALTMPKWRAVGAGMLAGIALLGILAGAACIALLGGLAGMY